MRFIKNKLKYSKMTEYSFVGNNILLNLIKPELKGFHIKSMSDVELWISKNHQQADFNHEITATFVIDLNFNLLVNDRHSEHVVCANGQNILSAGEITFEILAKYKNKKSKIIISKITNLSTGYCPSPTSWIAIQKTLEKIDIPFPTFFTTAFQFRICNKCGWINVIKDNFFVCLNEKCKNELAEIE